MNMKLCELIDIRRTAARFGAVIAGTVAVAVVPGIDVEAQVDQSYQLALSADQSTEWKEQFDSDVSDKLEITSRDPMYSSNSIKFITQSIRRYRYIVTRGGWPRLPNTENVLRLGYSGEEVPLLRQRLLISGDLRRNLGTKDTFDSYVEGAVRRFQWRHGLTQNGIVSPQTLEELNVPAIVRLKQLESNLERINELSSFKSETYVIVNIPAAEIEAVENGRVHSRHTAVVGKIDRQTPLLKSSIHELNFNPHWTVPKSIIRRDLIPLMNEDPEYLTKNKIRIFDWYDNELTADQIDWQTEEAVNYLFKQDPGAENSLGTVKINFHNKYAVYLHDTPSKSLFGTEFRFHSSGCVRVQNVRGLITWLLNFKNTDWNRQKIDQVIRTGERLDVKLKQKVPILTTYITAWSNADGTVHFRSDIYKRDVNTSLGLLSDG